MTRAVEAMRKTFSSVDSTTELSCRCATDSRSPVDEKNTERERKKKHRRGQISISVRRYT